MEKDEDDPLAAAALALMEEVAAAYEAAEANANEFQLWVYPFFGMKYNECNKWDDPWVSTVIHGVRRRSE